MNQADLRKALSLNIKRQRKRYGLTQERLAEETGLSAQTINDIEGSRTWVSDKTLIRLSEVLHVTPAELLSQTAPQQSDSFDFSVFKAKLQDSVLQTIENEFKKSLSRGKAKRNSAKGK